MEENEKDFFPARWFRISTLISIGFIIILGILVLIGEMGETPEKLLNFWNETLIGLNMILIGTGEVAILVILQASWEAKIQSQRSNFRSVGIPLLVVGVMNIILLVVFNRFSQFINIISQLWTYQLMVIIILSILLVIGLYLVLKTHSLHTFLGYVFLGFLYSMVMEFCIDYGAYGIYPWRNGEMVQIVMLGLSLHYFAFVAIFRIWYELFDFTPKEAYLAMGITGFMLEVFILPIIAGSFNIWLLILFPFYFFINVFNYGSFVVIPTLYHQESGLKTSRPSSIPFSKILLKYVISVGGTLLLGIFEIYFFYSLLFGVF